MTPVEFNKEYLISELMRINDIVNNLNPKCQKADYWAINDGGAEYISIHKEDHDENCSLEAGGWNDVKNINPELDKLFDEYGLYKFVGKINTSVWPIHRHVFSTSSISSLTVFADNVENSTLHFYNVNDNTQYNDNYIYDTMSYDSTIEPDISIKVQNKDVFCLDTWLWHSYDTSSFADVFLLYPKNISNNKDKEQYINFLKSK